MSDSETSKRDESIDDIPGAAADEVSNGVIRSDGSNDSELSRNPEEPPFLSLPQVRYPNAYTWLVFASSLDIMLTFLVLHVWGGYEVNPVAAAVIEESGYEWAIIFKFTIVALVVVACEIVGRHSDRDGLALARGAVVISAIPVAYTFILLLVTGPAGASSGP